MSVLIDLQTFSTFKKNWKIMEDSLQKKLLQLFFFKGLWYSTDSKKNQKIFLNFTKKNVKMVALAELVARLKSCV